MAVVTITAAAAVAPPKQHHVGVQSLHFQYAAGATAIGTVGDTLILAKLPHQATILDMAARLGQKADTAASLIFFITKGKTASETTTLAIIGTISDSATAGTVHFRPGATTELPYVVSLSDDDAIQYALLKVRFAVGTATASFSIDGWINFAMNAEPS
jgi:hypothetical protein